MKPFKFPASAYECKVTLLRECPTREELQQCATPDKVAAYWRMPIATHMHFDAKRECFAVQVTRDLIRAGQLLKIELLDHIVIGAGNFTSLRSLGYFAEPTGTVSEIASAMNEKSKPTVAS